MNKQKTAGNKSPAVFCYCLVVSFFVESFFIDVSFFIVSVAAGVVTFEVSLEVVSLPLALFDELQPVAIEPIIAATSAKLKICFFMGFDFLVFS